MQEVQDKKQRKGKQMHKMRGVLDLETEAKRWAGLQMNHCPVSDLTPYAKKMAANAMASRIAHQEDRLDRLISTQRRVGHLWLDKKFTQDGVVDIKRRFLVWGSQMSPYAIIEDAEARIIELS